MRHISPETTYRIQELSKELERASTFYTDTHQFAVDYEDRAYDDEDILSFRTLIVGGEWTLGISVIDQNDRTVIFENIDLLDDGVPMIVRPDYGGKEGVDALKMALSGERIGRPVIRALTEYEGNALIEDLEVVLDHADINRLIK